MEHGCRNPVHRALADAAGETALDLYCGVGLFTIPLARRFKQVVGVESSDKAVDFAEKNAAIAHTPNIRFVRQSARKFLAGYKAKSTDFLLIDPPRSGAEKGWGWFG